MSNGVEQGGGANTSAGTSNGDLLREICELKETLRLERSKNIDNDSEVSR